MKKILFIMALLGAGAGLTSCDPLKDKGDFVTNTITAESLLKGATFAQYDMHVDDNGNEVYTPSDMGNYIEYNIPSVPAVTIKSPDGKILSYGRSGGIFYYLPKRGSDTNQTIHICYINDDGSEVMADKQFTMEVAQALDPAVKVLVSNAGVKKWKWMPSSANNGAVWGNGGYLAGEQNGSLDINGAWWGCGVLDGDCADTFSGQTQHAGGKYDEIEGECYALSYMEFNEDGSLTAYSDKGVKINTGTFSIKDYKDNEITNQAKLSRGTLETSEGAILWPFAINKNGFMPTKFDIGYLDEGRMVLIYADEGVDPYSECTWWSFMSDDDAGGILASHEWHWKPSQVNGGAVWGNGGYMAGSQSGDGSINGAWWGCGTEDGDCPDKFNGQTQHTGGVDASEETWNASKMVFDEDEATVTVYGKDGNQLRQGSFSFDMTPNAATFSVGTLTTSEGAILWPFAINKNGLQPTKFEIGYLGMDAMVLIYAPEGTDPYGECTWWSFGK